MNDDDDDGANLFEVIYRGGRHDNDYRRWDFEQNPNPPQYHIPADVHIRLIVDQSVTEIDRFACKHCTALFEVVFHGNVTQISRFSFEYCSNLQHVELPAGLVRLESFVFYNCTSLNGEITIPASVQYMGNFTFKGCKSLQSVVFAPRTTNGVVELGRNMFSGCTDLRSVTLPQDLQSIPLWFFQGCTSLTHLQIPESVVEIRSNAFRGSALQSITIPENVQQIHQDAFRDCAFLERVTIHSTNLTMDNNIFANCPTLSTIMIAPWLWPTLFASMNEHPDFIFKFFRQYPTQIFNGGGGA